MAGHYCAVLDLLTCYCLRSFRTQQLGTASSASSQRLPHILQPNRQFLTQPSTRPCLNQSLVLAEVEVGLQQLHSGRSGALHGYTSDFLHYAKLVATPDIPALAHLLAPCLVVLFNAAFSTGQVPQSWKTSFKE